jgi:hypothetical protein
LNDALAKGELLLLSAAISAAAAGEVVGTTDGPRWKTSKLLGVSLSILVVVIATYWFADVASAAASAQTIDRSAIANGSLVVFGSSIVTSAACIMLSGVR